MKLYIDPGTASMLFTALIGIIGVARFGAKGLLSKIKVVVLRDKTTKLQNETIPFAIFSDDKRYWQTFKPICEELNRRGFETVYLTASKDDPVFQEKMEHIHPQFIGENNKAFAYMNYLKANVVLSTTPGLDVYQWKRSKNVKEYIHIPHGANDSTTGYRMFGLDFYDSVLVSGEYQIDTMRRLEQLRHLPEKESIIVGVPYLDVLKKRKDNTPPNNHSGINVLIAPTWGKSSLLHQNGEQLIQTLLDHNYHVIIRPHPQSWTAEADFMDKLMTQFPSSDNVEWNREPDNFDVLNRSDIMLSDYSGVIFDFAFIFDRPVISTNADVDYSPLDIWWLKEPLWSIKNASNIGPTFKKENIERIDEIIKDALTNQTYIEKRHQAMQETWQYPEEGAQRTVDFILQKYHETTPSQS